MNSIFNLDSFRSLTLAPPAPLLQIQETTLNEDDWKLNSQITRENIEEENSTNSFPTELNTNLWSSHYFTSYISFDTKYPPIFERFQKPGKSRLKNPKINHKLYRIPLLLYSIGHIVYFFTTYSIPQWIKLSFWIQSYFDFLDFVSNMYGISFNWKWSLISANHVHCNNFKVSVSTLIGPTAFGIN